jgi:hypothetical protein
MGYKERQRKKFLIHKRVFTDSKQVVYDVDCHECAWESRSWDYRTNALSIGFEHVNAKHNGYPAEYLFNFSFSKG